MSILNVLNNIESSTIYKLRYNNKILGFRVKYYSLESKDFNYYDFALCYVKNKQLQNWLNSISGSLESLDLIDFNGDAFTQDEIDGKIKVLEFKDEASAEKILNLVKEVMNG